jgi:hypothetical protein
MIRHLLLHRVSPDFLWRVRFAMDAELRRRADAAGARWDAEQKAREPDLNRPAWKNWAD